MQPDAAPERDTAEQEALLARHLGSEEHPAPGLTLLTWLVALLGMAMACALALLLTALHLADP